VGDSENGTTRTMSIGASADNVATGVGGMSCYRHKGTFHHQQSAVAFVRSFARGTTCFESSAWLLFITCTIHAHCSHCFRQSRLDRIWDLNRALTFVLLLTFHVPRYPSFWRDGRGQLLRVLRLTSAPLRSLRPSSETDRVKLRGCCRLASARLCPRWSHRVL